MSNGAKKRSKVAQRASGEPLRELPSRLQCSAALPLASAGLLACP